MKLLLDMNLSPAWVPLLGTAGWEAAHWSTIGAVAAKDADIMAWAKGNGFTVITNDLDFSAILAATRGEGPSVPPLPLPRTSQDVREARQERAFSCTW